MKHKIFFNQSEVLAIAESSSSLSTNEMAIWPSGTMMREFDTLRKARYTLLTEGINVRMIEDALGIPADQLGKFHVQDILDWNGYQRKVDLCIMHVVDTDDFFSLVLKVKHYLDGAYAGDQQPDHITVLQADDTTEMVGPDGEPIGEKSLWYYLMQSGAIDLPANFAYFINQRDLEGRFNQKYAA
jgi:hypothetical protein